MRGALGIALALFFLLGLFEQAEGAELPSEDIPTRITADELIFDRLEDVVTARGNVEISQNERVLLADEVIYAIGPGKVTARGNVKLLEPSGDVFFADNVELDDRLTTGFIERIRVLMRDETRISASRAERSEGRYIVLTDGVFSPCRLCPKDPEKPPLWQIKAREVTHDQEEKTIEYRDAWMEYYGLPVFYTPYFQHPDPTVDRQSGLLPPMIGAGENLGFTLEVPYFYAIDETKDLTLSPIITTKQSVVLAGEYRQLFENGAMAINASGTVADREDDDGSIENDRLRGHIDATGRFNIDPTWRTGFDLRRASDDTYLRLYDFSAERTLTSRLFVEGFRQRNYAAANAYAYQGLREEDDNDEFPIIAPSFDYNFIGEPGFADGRFYADAGMRVLTRVEGRDNRRLSLTGGYEIPYTGPIGDVYNLKAQVQSDGYWTRGGSSKTQNVNPPNSDGDELTGRFLPQLGLQWRYPWIQDNGSWQQVIEPIGQIVAAPSFGNPDEIPNEDSIGFEFDDSNIFELNRFPGVDRADSGSRIDYGFNWRGDFGTESTAEAFVGQSYQIVDANNEIFPENAGVGDGVSDFVGRVQLSPLDEFDLLYRFRLDDQNLQPRRHEIGAQFGVPAFEMDLGYLFVDNQATSEDFDDREEININAQSQLTNTWNIFGSFRRDLDAQRTLSWSIGMGYEDECFTVEGVFRRRFFDDREIDPENTFTVQFVFKHLGSVKTP